MSGNDTSNDERIALALAEAEQQKYNSDLAAAAAAQRQRNPSTYPGMRQSIPRGRVLTGSGSNNNSYPPGAGTAYHPPNHTNNSFQRRVRSHMCHVPCLLGSDRNVCVEMMVDTGAESSVISLQLAKELKLESCIDRTHQGIASGVGKARIVGMIRNVVATFGHVEFRMEFLVLEVPERLLIMGMDQMRKYNCIIDLQKDVIVFGGTGGVEVPMLPPDQAPKYDARMMAGEMCTIS